ncbi:hypothetical protein MXD59_14015 [Frankia sp. Ag45/Mut15]|uniref:Uncharacterized protein n=1 Tax=Frankia umida TaxID=573489 RepID=A0ABT0JZB3_9ACTN|nr:hypothetical protein [Frankia umida]MCK9876883.1 hypothetical protein [Frankia umida]
MTGTGAVGVGGDGQAVPTGTPTEVPGQDRCGSGHWSARSRTEPSEQVTLVGCSVGWSVVPGSDRQIGVAAGAGAAPLAEWPGWPGRRLGHCGEFPVPVGQVASAVRCVGAAEVLGQDRPGQSASAEPAGVDVADGQGAGPGGGGAQLSVCPPVAALPEAATTPFVAITGTRETVAFGGQAVGLGDSQAGTNALEAMLARQSSGWVGQALVAEAVGEQLAEPGEVMPALGVPVVGGDVPGVPGVPGVPVPVDGVPVVGLVVAAVGAGVVGSGFGSALGVDPPVGDPASPEPPEPPSVGGPVVVVDPPPEVGEAPSVVVPPAPAAGVDPVDAVDAVEPSVAAALVGSPAAAALIGTPAPAGVPNPVATPAPTHSSRTLRKMTATEPRDDRSPRDAPNRDDRAVHRPAARWPDIGRPPGANGNTAITARQHSSLKTRGARLTLRA